MKATRTPPREGYVVISNQTVGWAKTLITRLSEGRPVNPLEIQDIQRELDQYDPLDTILQEAAHVHPQA